MASPDLRPDLGAQREQAAARIDRYRRRVWLGVLPLALIAVADLATGALTSDRRADAALLIATGLSVCSTFSLKRLARRLREPLQPTRASPRLVVRGIASLVLSLAIAFAFGYLVGGLVLAIVIVGGSIALIFLSVVLGIRTRRRREREAADFPRSQP